MGARSNPELEAALKRSVEALGKNLGAISHCGAVEVGPRELRDALQGPAQIIRKQERERVKEALGDARESAWGTENFLGKVLRWEGSDEDELAEAIEDAEKVCTALNAIFEEDSDV